MGNETSPNVFISYSHDSPAHRQCVLEFSERLRADGIDAHIDQYSPWPKEGWPRWMERHISGADFVLMICTETYSRRISDQEDPGLGLGVCWEANLIYNHLYVTKIKSTKFVPIVFRGGSPEHIPLVLKGRSHFSAHTDEGYDELYRLMTGQPKVVAGPLRQLRKLPLHSDIKSPEQSPVSAETSVSIENKRKIFISYPQGDPAEENLARFLHGGLTASGHQVFLDIGMATGTDWITEITNRIHWCDFLIVLLSERSMASEMVHSEVRLAHLRHGETGSPRIVPVRVRYFGPLEYELDLYLNNLQYVKWNSPQDSERVQREVLRATEVELSEHVTTATARLTAPREPQPVDRSLRPRAMQDTRSASAPGGTIRPDDPCYILRPQDEETTQFAGGEGYTGLMKWLFS